eukprot:gene15560-17788_t
MQLEVKSGAVIAQVTGGTTRKVYIEDLVVIDGSLSYDEDHGTSTMSRLRFGWSCSLLSAGQFGTSCNDVLVGRNTSSSILFVAGALLDPTRIYGFTMTATAQDGRFGAVTVSIQQLTSNTASTSISTTKSIVNADSSFSVVGVVTANFTVRARWSSDVEGTNLLLSSALTPLERVFSRKEAVNGIQFPLIFPGGVMIQGTSVTFRLTAMLASLSSADTSLASVNEIVVTVNSAPTGGKITSDPVQGTALFTTFSIISSEWSDVDMPLTYDFAHFISVNIPVMSISLRSSSNVVSTELPEGSAGASFVVTIINNIYDSSLAYTNVNSSVIVTADDSIDPTAYFKAQTSLYGSTFDTSKATAALNTVAVTVNRVNCSLVPVAYCESLNRQACELTPQTCSSCLPGFAGRSGNANSLCFNSTANATVARLNEPCLSDSQCFFGSCVDNVCVAPVKTCPSSSPDVCSGHGVCTYLDQLGNDLYRVCSASEGFCIPSCKCDTGFGGADCSLSAADVASRNNTRAAMCNYVLEMSMTLEPSSQLLDTLVGSLLVAYDPTEVISPGAIQICQDALTAVADLAAGGYLRNALPSTKTFLVNLVSEFVSPASANASSSDQVNAAASSVAQAFINSMVDGQDPQYVVSDNAQYVFRRDLASDAVDSIIQPPGTEDASSYGTASSGVQLLGPAVEACNNGNGYIGLSLMQWGTNPFRQPNGTVMGSAQLKFSNFGSNNSYAGPVDNTTISYYIINQFNEPQDFNFSLSLADALVAQIPNFTFPECTLYDGEKYVPCQGCSVSTYTNYNVTFACTDPFQLCGGRSGATRRLLHDSAHLSQWQRPRRYLQGTDDGEETGSDSIQYAALFSAIGAQISSVLSRNPFAVDWAKASAIVTFVCLMFFGLVSGYIFFDHWDKVDRGFLVYAKNETDKARIKMRHAYMLKMQLQDQKLAESESEREAAVMKAKKMFRISENTYHILQEAFAKEEEQRINLLKRVNGTVSRLSHRFGLGDVQLGSFKSGKEKSAKDSSSGRAELKKQVSRSKHLFDMFREEDTERHLEYNAIFEEEDHMESRDELYVANVVADFLVTVMPEGSVSTGKAHFMGLLHRMLKEHDYTAMFYDASLKYPRSLRWLNVCMQLLINLFVDTIFFGVFYPDTGLCETYQTKIDCITPRNSVLDAPLCRWNLGDNPGVEAPTCGLVPPPNDFTFQCILVVMSQLVGLPIAFFYDFLIKEFCARRPNLDRWGLSTTYFLGRSTQTMQAAATHEEKEERYLEEVNFITTRMYGEFAYSTEKEAELLLEEVKAFLDEYIDYQNVPWQSSKISAVRHAKVRAIQQYLGILSDGRATPLSALDRLRFGNPKAKLCSEIASIVALVVPYLILGGFYAWRYYIVVPAMRKIKTMNHEIQHGSFFGSKEKDWMVAKRKNRKISFREYASSLGRLLYRALLLSAYYLHSPFKIAADFTEVFSNHARKRKAREIRQWQLLNIDQNLHGRVDDEKNNRARLGGIAERMQINNRKTSLKEGRHFHLEKLRELVASLPEPIQAMQQATWTHSWDRKESKPYVTECLNRYIFGLQPHTDVDESQLTLLAPGETPPVHSIAESTEQVLAYRHTFTFYKDVNTALNRMLQTYQRLVADGEAKKVRNKYARYLSQITDYGECDALIHISDYIIMMNEVWELFHPAGVEMDEEEQTEVVHTFSSWMIAEGYHAAYEELDVEEEGDWWEKYSDQRGGANDKNKNSSTGHAADFPFYAHFSHFCQWFKTMVGRIEQYRNVDQRIIEEKKASDKMVAIEHARIVAKALAERARKLKALKESTGIVVPVVPPLPTGRSRSMSSKGSAQMEHKESSSKLSSQPPLSSLACLSDNSSLSTVQPLRNSQAPRVSNSRSTSASKSWFDAPSVSSKDSDGGDESS